MRNVIDGFTGWVRMHPTNNESLQVVDAAITIVGTMLVALAWTIVRH